MKYYTPEMEIVHLKVKDIITTSSVQGNEYDENKEPIITPSKPGDWS